MKEITRIHLAQTPYDIEIDAKKVLQKYLADIEKSFQSDDDTTREIEARMVEILIESGVVTGKVVTSQDVEAIKQQLGEPGEFVDETTVEAAVVHSNKRLMRDTEEGILGGVLSGVAAYYDVNVMWVRLGAILLSFVSLGAAFVLYIVLWIITPEAKTIADKLQLRGERVTLESIKMHSGETANTTTKPLVRILQILIGLGWVGLAVLSLVALMFGTVAIFGPGASLIGDESMSGMSAWVIASFIGMIVCGVLAVLFFSIAAYASFAWKMNKRIAVALITIGIAGIVLASAVIGAGLFGKYNYDKNIEANTIHKTIQIEEKLSGVDSLYIDSKKASVRYIVVDDEQRIEIDAVNKEAKPPVVTLEKNGNNATLTVDSSAIDDCENDIFCNNSAHLIVFGPQISEIKSSEGSNVYYDARSQLDLDRDEVFYDHNDRYNSDK